MIGGNLTGERRTTAKRNVAGLWLNSQFRPLPYAGAGAGFRVSTK